MKEETGYLVLSTGDVLEGKWLGSKKSSEGEMVFNTAMTGYQEVITDPSYAGQIVTMTYPLIGNYGFNDSDSESIKPSLSGLIISEPCHRPDHYQADYSLVDMVKQHDIPTLCGIDTRALTRIIREHGEVYGKITSNRDELPKMNKIDENLVKQVSVTETKNYKTKTKNSKVPHVLLIDFGYKSSITHSLLDFGCDVTVVPFDTPFEKVQQLNPDGVVLSNGPGDPKHLSYLKNNIKRITEGYPTLGICLGHQLVALAHGAKTKRLPYGHRGSNHPVKDLETGKVFITSQNHGYVVDMDSVKNKDWQVTYVNVNDRSVEGLVHKKHNVRSVQFHPEAHPGPIDTHSIFSTFTNQLITEGEKQHA